MFQAPAPVTSRHDGLLPGIKSSDQPFLPYVSMVSYLSLQQKGNWDSLHALQALKSCQTFIVTPQWIRGCVQVEVTRQATLGHDSKI